MLSQATGLHYPLHFDAPETKSESLMDEYTICLAVTLAVTALLTVVSHGHAVFGSGTRSGYSREFISFRTSYLAVYALMMGADWLQGPYVYALYDAYGYSQHKIAVLFVAGFGSSFLFGTWLGALADVYGRKRWCTLFAVVYIGSCATKHFNHYPTLILGRILAGIATSLLYSVFESWMVKEHAERGFNPDWLTSTFSLAMFWNSVVAIAAGVIAQKVSDLAPLQAVVPDFNLMAWGFCAPFDAAALCLGLGGLLILATWPENYGVEDGQRGQEGALFSSEALREALHLIWRDKRVFRTGVIQSLFEGAMYTFVFMWTPALTLHVEELPPYGIIFATFMVCCMAGSNTFEILTRMFDISPSHALIPPLVLSTIALLVPAFTTVTLFRLGAFLVFEFCVGMYFPAIGMIKSGVVPEQSRSAVYNVFRVPLNIIVLGVLVTNVSVKVSMLSCSAMLLVAALTAVSLARTDGGKNGGYKGVLLEMNELGEEMGDGENDHSDPETYLL